jgi:predicted permease
MLSDIRTAIRTLRHDMAYTTTAVGVLALGIGANAALLTVLSAAFWRPLPGLTRPGELARVCITRSSVGYYFTAPEIDDVVAMNDAFMHAAAFTPVAVDVVGLGEPERRTALVVTPRYFATLGVSATVGRCLTPEDRAAAVISDRLWRTRFDASRAAVGTDILLNGVSFTIVGVAPPRFSGSSWTESKDTSLAPDFWVPAATYGALVGRTSRPFTSAEIVARLKPGRSLASVNSALSRWPPLWAERRPAVRRCQVRASALIGAFALPAGVPTVPILATFIIPGIVLLVACANVAALFLARAVGRGRDLAVRRALGASRWRVVRELLVEHVALALIAGAVGLLLARWATNGLLWLLDVPDLLTVPDLRIVGAILAICAASVLLSGLAPAVLTVTRARPDLLWIGRVGPARRARAQRALVVAQVALSLALLAAGAVLVNAVSRAVGRGATTASDRVLTGAVDLGRLPDAQRRAAWGTLVRDLAAVPGVQTASLAAAVPFGGGDKVYGRIVTKAQGDLSSAFGVRVWPGFFAAVGLPLVSGRDFTTADDRGAPPVVIVSEELARLVWPDSSPVGRTLFISDVGVAGDQFTVAGVAANDESGDPNGLERACYYLPLLQAGPGSDRSARITMIVRSDRPAGRLAADLFRIARAVDPTLAVFGVSTQVGLVERNLAPKRAVAWLVMLFGLLALTLATSGIYGAVSYAVAHRSHEFGIRMALGATPRDIVRQAVLGAARVAVTGLAIGLLLSVAAARALVAVVVPGEPIRPEAVGAGCLLVAGAVLLASYVPARRAARVDPLRALRAD